MKRFAFLFLLFLAAAGVRAQEMGVECMRTDMMDMTAATYPRHDLNGKPCAVVKVRMPEGAAFEGNIIGSTEYRTGEYWVYMTAGTKFLRVKHATARPLHIAFADHGIPQLESKATYILDITMPAAAAPAQSAASGRNYAVFTVEPPTATVTIEGAAHEARAGKVNVLLRHGVHAYTVEAPGYLPERGSVTVGTQRAELSVRLRSAKGAIAVTCATPGTEIYVNGDRVGSGTWQGEFAPGEYLVEGRLASHRPVEQLATVVMGEKCTVALPALSAITGSLDVNFEPNGATISIDGTARGTTPAMLDGVLAGSHAVTISATGYTPQTHTVTIADSQTASLSGSLSKAAASAPAHTSNASSARPFSLCAQAPDGSIVYFTADEWKALSIDEQDRYKKKGVVLEGKREKFLVELDDKEGGESMEWADALKYNLPTIELGQVMADNKDALNDALRAFGGTIIMNTWYWTKTEHGSSHAWLVSMNDGSALANLKTITYRVRAVAPVPVVIADSQTASLSGSLSKAAASAPAHTNNASSARPFSLCAEAPDGSIVYFTADEWKALSIDEQDRYKKKGVVLAGNGEKFLVELEDAEGGKWKIWDYALKYNLPTKQQGQVIVDNKDALNNALRAFGGAEMRGSYWTNTEYDSSHAWLVGMFSGFVGNFNKAFPYRVRAVAPVPEAEAM